ncbi:MAG TPA: DUF819 family protein [Steroidobacteraceae bacterium]|nr:DUF819 family protein [Steroidobacteraceae bacterium]
MIHNDAVILGLLAATLGVVFWTTQSAQPFWKRFYKYVPALLLCYFVPALYNSFGLIDGEHSKLYFVASRYLLPATLVLLTLAIDLPATLRLGPKALAMFFAGTLSVVLGGPVALLIWKSLAPASVDGELWRGMSAIAGSWIGGAANQAAMKDVFSIEPNLFGVMVAVDVVFANLWLAVLLWMAANQQRVDRWLKADTTSIAALGEKMERLRLENERIPLLPELMIMLALAFGATGLSHALAVPLASAFAEVEWAVRLSLASEFFWIVVLATTFGLLLSFTRARNLEGAGASRLGSALLYVLIATVGMQMDIGAVLTSPVLFGIGFTWIAFHAVVILVVARLIRAPAFFLAVGSQANIGGAASAPVVAAAFYPSLAPVGVLLAVLGYALGTYGGWLCGQLMRLVSQ